MWHVRGKREMHRGFVWGNLKEGGLLQDVGEVRIIQRVLRK